MELRIKTLDENAVIPSFAHDSDAGLDLSTIEDVTIAQGERVVVKTGLAMAIPNGYVGLIWDRSGMAAKRGMKTMAGVVDAGYRGEVMVALLNAGAESQEFKIGDRIAQMLIQEINQPDINVVEELDDTSRGEAAFGSTGLSAAG